MAEPASEDLHTVTSLGPGSSPGPRRSHCSRPLPPLTCADVDHNEQFIRMMIHLALRGERITGASEEGGNMTTADEKTDPLHIPLPHDTPVTATGEEHMGPDGAPATVLPLAPTPADADVDAQVDVVDAQVTTPDASVVSLQGSGAELVIPPMPTSPPTTPESAPDWWRVSRNEPRSVPQSKGSPRDTRSGWWDRLYKDQNADLDTYTGHVLTVPADGGPVLIEVQKSAEPEAPEAQAAGAEDSTARPQVPQVVDVPRPQPTLQIRTPPTRRWRPSRFWRVIAFNGSAAAVGSVVGLNAYLSQFPPAAVTAAGGLLGAGMALGGAFTAWKVAGSEMLAPFVPFGAVGRLGAVFGTAEVGRRLGQAVLPYTSDAVTRYVGLNLTDTSLLVVGLTMCGASGWLVWRTRHGALPKRWLARIPLATSLLVCALYSNGAVL